jgi:hypothetical protein
MNRSEEPRTEPTPDEDESNRDQSDEDEVTVDSTDPETPLIDQDFEGSVNAALHDTDE